MQLHIGPTIQNTNPCLFEGYEGFGENISDHQKSDEDLEHMAKYHEQEAKRLKEILKERKATH